MPTVKDVLEAMIKAHEIQGGLALENSFNRVNITTATRCGISLKRLKSSIPSIRGIFRSVTTGSRQMRSAS